jgi:hypothetical protein
MSMLKVLLLAAGLALSTSVAQAQGRDPDRDDADDRRDYRGEERYRGRDDHHGLPSLAQQPRWRRTVLHAKRRH